MGCSGLVFVRLSALCIISPLFLSDCLPSFDESLLLVHPPRFTVIIPRTIYFPIPAVLALFLQGFACGGGVVSSRPSGWVCGGLIMPSGQMFWPHFSSHLATPLGLCLHGAPTVGHYCLVKGETRETGADKSIHLSSTTPAGWKQSPLRTVIKYCC